MFGENHAYGRSANAEDYDDISSNLLIDFHESNYLINKSQIIICGRSDEAIIKLLDKHIGSLQVDSTKKLVVPSYDINSAIESLLH